MIQHFFINGLIKQIANVQLEFIGDFNEAVIAKTVCAFLNADGGWVVVGHNGKVIQKIVGDKNEHITDLYRLINNEISPQPLVDIRIEEYAGEQVLLLNIVKGSRQPYSFKGNYYIRKKGKTKIADADELSLLLRQPNEYISTWEKQTVSNADIEDLMQEEIKHTIAAANKLGRADKLPKDMMGFLGYFQLADMYLIKNGGILLFGKNPAAFMTQSLIRITVMPYGKTGSKFGDSLLIEDNLFIAFNRIQEYFKNYLPIISEFKNNEWNRDVREKYPMDALDEAILNAMVHRDYGDIAGDITINIYPDKIEITNSGEIPGDIITGKNRIKEHHSILRNPAIAHIFYLRGKIEKLGRGLTLINQRFKEYGLKAPEWTFQNGYTTLVLYGIANPMAVNDRMVKFLSSIEIGVRFTRDDYEIFFEGKISEKTAVNDIGKLVKGDWIVKVGEGPSTSYTRSSKKIPEITR